MGFKSVIIFLLVFILIGLMFLYIIPLNVINFEPRSNNNNFSIMPGSEMQFYPNMRFPSNEISYQIINCPLQKQNDMEYAFGIMENLTSLVFYPVDNNEEISITCQEKNKVSGGSMFIAGEGGPTNITVAGEFNVITSGEILLIKESNCPKPNVALHELFHVLGFQHSTNQDNIMYNVTSCSQTIGTDMINLINNLYSVPSYPDLIFVNASASMAGRFLNINMTVMNAGLNVAGQSEIDIYTDQNLVKEVSLTSLGIGVGRIITMQNIFIPQINVHQLTLTINNNFNELSKDNNNITLEIT